MSISEIEGSTLYNSLSRLGSVVSLDFYLEGRSILEMIEGKYGKYLVPYNKEKGDYRRYGLSLTSLDGGMSGVPNLTSILEYNKKYGTSYDEEDFKTWTPFLKECHYLHELFNLFGSYVGRSHILKLDAGGFFPVHRDSPFIYPKCFRLIAPIDKVGRDYSYYRYVFTLDRSIIHFNSNSVYFVDTVKEHSLFSFEDAKYFLVMNIETKPEAVQTVLNNLEIY